MSNVTYQPIQSGSTNYGNNTPNGGQFVTFVDNPYVSQAEFLMSQEAISLGLTSSSPIVASGQLANYILQASAWVNRYTDRWFDMQRVWETSTGFVVRPYNPQLITVRARNGPPYNTINQMYIQVLKWFIAIDLSSTTGYLQDFYDNGYCKIVPLLSNSGSGTGSPLPAAIVDRIPLGVLWMDYTSGFGTQLTKYAMGTGNGTATVFQAATGNQLWCQSNNLWSQQINVLEPLTVYENGVVVSSTNYTVDYVNGKITFNTPPANGVNISADFWTYESIPADVKYATILKAIYDFGWAAFNPMMNNNLSVPGLNISYDKETQTKRVENMLESYRLKRITLI
jgi:hypothetical protein